MFYHLVILAFDHVIRIKKIDLSNEYLVLFWKLCNRRFRWGSRLLLLFSVYFYCFCNYYICFSISSISYCSAYHSTLNLPFALSPNWVFVVQSTVIVDCFIFIDLILAFYALLCFLLFSQLDKF